MLPRTASSLLRAVPRACVPQRTFATSAAAASNTLLFVEYKNGALNPATLSAVTAAKKLGGEVHGLVVGAEADAKAISEKLSKVEGLDKVLVSSSDKYKNFLAEPIAPLLKEVTQSKGYTYLVAGHTAVGRDIVPRASALLDSQQVSDIIAVDNSNTFNRPIYAGNAIATVKTSDKTIVFTVRGTAFDAAKEEGGSASIEDVAPVDAPAPTEFLEEKINQSSRPDLGTAARVVSGGRALKSGDNFVKYIEPLADKLQAAVGASRAAVDAGYADNALQVGQTGKIVAPELYMAIGISGAIQHLAGMKDSKTIVAINKVRLPLLTRAHCRTLRRLFSRWLISALSLTCMRPCRR